MMIYADFVRRALAVPFVPRGRSWEGWDCWGLIVLAYREIKDVELPSYDDYNDKLAYKELSALVDAGRPLFRATTRPEPGNVALYRVGRYPAHVGLVVPHGRLLHCEQGTGTICPTLRDLAWRDRLEGYYEYG